jgi:hypothetical protein
LSGGWNRRGSTNSRAIGTWFGTIRRSGKRGELADKFSVHGPCVGSYRVNVKSFIVTIENRGALPAQLAAMLLGATD